MNVPEYEALELNTIEGEEARNDGELLAACREIFSDFDEDYLTQRLRRVADPALTAAWNGNQLVGFKLAYRRGPTLLYSWLGGVHPRFRRQRLAARLMDLQHEWAKRAGYSIIETRTRAANNSMIVLNLRHGFELCGYEVDSKGVPVVTQRKLLQASPSSTETSSLREKQD